MPKALVQVSRELIAEVIFLGTVEATEVRDNQESPYLEMVIEGPTLPTAIPGDKLPRVQAIITEHRRSIEFQKL